MTSSHLFPSCRNFSAVFTFTSVKILLVFRDGLSVGSSSLAAGREINLSSLLKLFCVFRKVRKQVSARVSYVISDDVIDEDMNEYVEKYPNIQFVNYKWIVECGKCGKLEKLSSYMLEKSIWSYSSVWWGNWKMSSLDT